MSWKITKLLVDDDGSFAVEFTNVSGGPLDTDDFAFLQSGAGNTGVNIFLFSAFGGPLIVQDGDSFTFGDTDFAETDLGAGSSNLNALDFIGIADSDFTTIDTIGDSDSGGLIAPVDAIYTAKPTRDVDINETNTFNINDDFDATTPFCFLAGTQIATPNGATSVEDLKPGDQVLTAQGKAVPVMWMGYQRVRTRAGVPERRLPVRIEAHAFGHDLPERDLVLTADHALLVDGFLINAGALINGHSVYWVPASDLGASYMVYHVETQAHDVILANGLAAETFVDAVSRRDFDNYHDYLTRFGAERLIPESARPRIASARLVPQSIKDKLSAHSSRRLERNAC